MSLLRRWEKKNDVMRPPAFDSCLRPLTLSAKHEGQYQRAGLAPRAPKGSLTLPARLSFGGLSFSQCFT